MSFDSKNYLFKNKEYGLGWTPARPLGWVILISHIVFIVGVSFYAEYSGIIYYEPEKFFILIAASILLLLAICWKTGEPLKWQWGNRRKR